MGAPRLLLRRKKSSSSNKAAVVAAAEVAAAPPPTTESTTTGKSSSALAQSGGIATTTDGNCTLSKKLLFHRRAASNNNSKNNNIPSAESSTSTADTTPTSSLNDVTTSSGSSGCVVDGESEQQQQQQQQQNNHPQNTNNNNTTTQQKKKKSVHLSITPDTEDSESMQVQLMDDGALVSPIKKEDCIYTVGSVEYLVKHPMLAMPESGGSGSSGNTTVSGGGGGNGTAVLEEVKDSNAIIELAPGSDKKKSKMGGLFKKGGGSKKGNDGGDKEQGSGSNNSGGGGGGSGGEDETDNNNNSGDDNNNNNNGRGNNTPNNNNNGPFDPLTYFGPHRNKFATESTLPLHSGPESTAPKTYPSWTPVDGTEFKVRVGPNYPKNGKKENSLESLYEVYAVRYYRSGKRTVGGATRIMPLPVEEEHSNNEHDDDVEGGDETNDGDAAAGENHAIRGGTHHPELQETKIPDVLVVHFMLPYEPPNMFKQKDDGPGGECVYYLRPSRKFLDEISGRITPPTPATALFQKWCEECESNFGMRSRFKCMALVRDIEKHNFGLLKSYNGKPVLITESGRVCSGFHGDVRYLEMTANVHYWAFMAKKGFVSLIPKFANMQMEVGFTIQAHIDSEMPECMLGSTVLSYISEKTGPMITPEMQEPVHEHQS
ncbi:hypothetical protein ACHAXR_010563 [Thalassiosira sp. AJA248-18]